MLLASMPSSAQQVPESNLSISARGQANYGRLPLTFEVNQGQVSPQVRLLSRGAGYTAFLTAGGMVLSLRPDQSAPARQSAAEPATKQSHQPNAALQFKLVGAAPNPVVLGEDQQAGQVNYFIGRDSAKWHTHVPTYARVRYKNIYPGIDLLYYGNQKQLEYDFAIAPGADHSRCFDTVQGQPKGDRAQEHCHSGRPA